MKDWKERFDKAWRFGVDDNQRKANVFSLIEQISADYWHELETERTLHKMQLDAMSLFSVKDLIKWKEQRLQILNEKL